MATNGADGAATPRGPKGLELFQPEINALIQRAGTAEANLEEKEKQLYAERQKLEDEKKQFYEKVGTKEQQLRQEVDKHAHEMKWERKAFNKEKEEFQAAQHRGTEIASSQEPVTVEVGGEKFRTEVSTLAKCLGSVFPKLVEPIYKRADGRKRDPSIFIDRDSKHFRFILNYLRQGEKVMRWSAMRNPDIYTLNEILDDVKYYQIASLEKLVLRKMASLKERMPFETMVKAKYFLREGLLVKFTTVRGFEIRDMNLTDITFTKVDFCHSVTFENCIMRSAKFSECHFRSALIFSNVDLYGAAFIRCEGLTTLDSFVFKDTDPSSIEITPQ